MGFGAAGKTKSLTNVSLGRWQHSQLQEGPERAHFCFTGNLSNGIHRLSIHFGTVVGLLFNSPVNVCGYSLWQKSCQSSWTNRGFSACILVSAPWSLKPCKNHAFKATAWPTFLARLFLVAFLARDKTPHFFLPCCFLPFALCIWTRFSPSLLESVQSSHSSEGPRSAASPTRT